MATLGATASTVTIGTAASSATGDFATAAQGTTADAAVAKSLYDANTVLYATTDNTPAALTVGASTIVGRKASGNIVALTAAETQTIINVIPLVTQVASGIILMPRCASTASIAPGSNVAQVGPIVIHGTHTITALSCKIEIAGTGSTVVRLGIYNNSTTTGQPGTVLVDAGTVAATSTGTKTISGLSTAITPGLYWVAMVFQTVTGTPQMAAGVGAPIICYDDGSLFNGTYSGYQQSSVSGAFGTWGGGGKDTRLPMIGLTV